MLEPTAPSNNPVARRCGSAPSASKGGAGGGELGEEGLTWPTSHHLRDVGSSGTHRAFERARRVSSNLCRSVDGCGARLRGGRDVGDRHSGDPSVWAGENACLADGLKACRRVLDSDEHAGHDAGRRGWSVHLGKGR